MGFLLLGAKQQSSTRLLPSSTKKKVACAVHVKKAIWSIVTLVVKLMWSHKEIVSFRLWEERGKVAYSRSKLPLPFIKVLWKQKGIFI